MSTKALNLNTLIEGAPRNLVADVTPADTDVSDVFTGLLGAGSMLLRAEAHRSDRNAAAPSLTITAQHSPDGSTWSTLGVFPAISTDARSFLQVATPCFDKLRFSYAVTTPGIVRVELQAITLAPNAQTVNVGGNTATAVTIPEVANDSIHRYTLTGNCTFTFPTATAGKSFTVALTQDATGSRTVTWPGTVKWPAASAPTITATATKTDVFRFVCVDGTNWVGFTVGQAYA